MASMSMQCICPLPSQSSAHCHMTLVHAGGMMQMRTPAAGADQGCVNWLRAHAAEANARLCQHWAEGTGEVDYASLQQTRHHCLDGVFHIAPHTQIPSKVATLSLLGPVLKQTKHCVSGPATAAIGITLATVAKDLLASGAALPIVSMT